MALASERSAPPGAPPILISTRQHCTAGYMQSHCPTAQRPAKRNSCSAWANIGVRFTLHVNFTSLNGADYFIIYKNSHSMNPLFLLQCELHLKHLIQWSQIERQYNHVDSERRRASETHLWECVTSTTQVYQLCYRYKVTRFYFQYKMGTEIAIPEVCLNTQGFSSATSPTPQGVT
jgi:hypothetical protein